MKSHTTTLFDNKSYTDQWSPFVASKTLKNCRHYKHDAVLHVNSALSVWSATLLLQHPFFMNGFTVLNENQFPYSTEWKLLTWLATLNWENPNLKTALKQKHAKQITPTFKMATTYNATLLQRDGILCPLTIKIIIRDISRLYCISGRAQLSLSYALKHGNLR